MGRWDFKEETGTPNQPASGYSSIYPKDDGYWYYQNDAGVETRFEESGGTLQNKIYYVGKHGNDSGTGKSLEDAFLTFNKAITEVNAQSPAVDNPYVIVCLDAGIYTENLTLLSYVHVFAPDATIVGNHILNDYATIQVYFAQAVSGTLISKTSGTGSALFIATLVILFGSANGTVCTSGSLEISITTLVNAGVGYGVGGSSTANINAIVNSADNQSTGRILDFSSTGKCNYDGISISDTGGGGTGIKTSSTGEVNVIVNNLHSNVAVNVGTGSTLRLIVGNLVGTETVVGNYYKTAAGQVPAHNTTHQSGGSDAIKLDDLAAPDDNTDLNASITKHGLLPKLANDATKYLNGVGAWTVPPVIARQSSEDAEDSTTSASWVQAWRDSVTLPAGTFIIFYSAEVTSTSGAGQAQARIQINDTTTIAEVGVEPESSASTEWMSMSGFYRFSTAGETINIDFDHLIDGSGSSLIRNKRIVILQTSEV